MRTDVADFLIANQAHDRRMYYVVQIIFDLSSPTFTSDEGLTGWPGTLIEGVVQSVSSVSQEVRPEEGRATIGAMTIKLVETGSPAEITRELREQLLDYDAGARDKEVRVYAGFDNDADAVTRVATMYVDGVSYLDGVYTIKCRDKSRALRDKIMEPKVTRIGASLAADDVVITVRDTSEFQMVAHNGAFSDAADQTVGYIRIEETKEIIRYTGKTATEFTGCTRGRFGTRAQAVELDPADSIENRPKVTEVIYLEMPGVAAALALQTGILDVSASPQAQLPDHWHLGLDWANDFVQSDWLNVGEDLWDTADDTAGFQVRILDPGGEDGKKFIESELYQLMGLYSPTNTAGKIGLRRMNRTITAAPVMRLNNSNVIKAGELVYDHSAVSNQFDIIYNWNGEDYTRGVSIVDTVSIERHGAAPTKTLQFKTLHTAKHTERAIKERIAVLRDRYAEPPLRLPLTVAPTLNRIEIGDVVLVELPSIFDHTADTPYLQRSFEVQRVQIDWVTGAVQLNLFASARLIESQTDNDDSGPVITDSWYTALGSNVTGLTGYSAGHLTASLTLTGDATALNAPGSIWYHDGDLTIDEGVTITIQNQAQLRVKGFLQVNGTVDGAGNGYSGSTDSGTIGAATTIESIAGTEGYIGPTRGSDGTWNATFDAGSYDPTYTVDGALTPSRSGRTAAGPLALGISGGNVTGLPGRLQGTSGGTGGRVLHTSSLGGAKILRARGGAGGTSGAGLLVVCRGLGFGVSGQIDLSGHDGSVGATTLALGSGGVVIDVTDTRNGLHTDFHRAAGGGAGGMPGTLQIILDGDGIPYPDINNTTFVAITGATPIIGQGAADSAGRKGGLTASFLRWPTSIPPRGVDTSPQTILTGLSAGLVYEARDMWAAAHYVQYMPGLPDAQEQSVPAPWNLHTSPSLGYVDVLWNWTANQYRRVEIFASLVNDRAFAEEVGEVSATLFLHPLPSGGERYYWIRVRDSRDGRVSEWHPTGATSGVYGFAQNGQLEWIISASNGRTWAGDGGTSPVTWSPAALYTDISAEVLKLGAVIASERIRVSRDSVGQLTWAYLNNDANITTTSTATPANTLRFTFTHIPSGITANDEIVAVLSGEGAEGPAGKPGSRVLTARANYSAFATPASGYIYVHGFDSAGNPADEPGEINFNGGVVTVAAGSIGTYEEIENDGWVIFDTALGGVFTGHGGTQTNIACARKTRSGWVYDAANASPRGWTSFTATAAMVVIGSYTRTATEIGLVTIIGNAIAMNSVPYERASDVLPGDLSPDAINDLLAFADTIRPVAVGSVLPTLPDTTNYPQGTLFYLIGDAKIYRADYTSSPVAWSVATDGADIVANSITGGKIQAGAISASLLEADLVLGSVIRTAGSGTRVELEGSDANSPETPFPFWIGTGSKGTVSGSPGSGAEQWYDKVTGRMYHAGALVAPQIIFNSSTAMLVETGSGRECAPYGSLRANGGVAVSVFADTAWHQVTVFGAPTLYHPDYGTATTDQYRRLQVADQPFLIDLRCTAINTHAAASAFLEVKYTHQYDGGSEIDHSIGTITVPPASVVPLVSQTYRKCSALGPGSGGWAQTTALRVYARMTSVSGTATVYVAGEITIPNIGAQGISASTL